jgi:oligosaccharide repeat unit polymerase
MAFFLGLIGEIRGRNIPLKEALNSKVIQLSNPGKWPTIELANSFGTFNIATYLFPKTYQYNYGIGILFRVAGFIPFIHRFLGLDKINIEKEYVYNSSSFFTYIINRGNMTSGAGTSCLADIYIEFGPWGVPVILFLWGLFLGWISIKIRTNASTNSVFIYSYLAYFAIYVNRSSFLFGWNAILWAFLIYFIIKRIFFVKY